MATAIAPQPPFVITTSSGRQGMPVWRTRPSEATTVAGSWLNVYWNHVGSPGIACRRSAST